ncbi:hypothetical protein [Neisseria sp. Ec49-e6-T10]|uniref:hypothetical protein n=1 Tax=Neisseria sp. Ec49-e6-T10 TaxID=3140744 RepID=UPI003EB6A1BE
MQIKCLGCEEDILQPAFLEVNLPCQTCESCGGNWILLKDYLQWKNSIQEKQTELTNFNITEITDTKKTLICPVTGKLMSKYRISAKTDHRLDFSVYANAIWLDNGEWLLLKQQGLATELNRIVTDAWQKQIRTINSKEVLEQEYRKKIGDEDYEKIKEIRDWLSTHPHADFLKAFIMADKTSK